MSRGRVKSVCPYCGVGCGIVMETEGGKVIKVSGDKSHPANRGRLCTKGQTCHLPLTEGRLASAYIRARGSADQNPVPTRAAIAETARRLSQIIAAHGPDAVSFYISGQMSLEAQYLANKLAKGFIRTRNIEANSRLCMASAASGYKLSLGADGPPGSYDDIDQANVFLVIGANMADCHPILFLRLMERVRQGAKLIVVDPRRTATAEKADLFLQIRPGTDIALLNGMLRLLCDAGAVAPAFIAAHTEGWEAMRALLADYPLERAAEVTGLAAEDIARAADWIGGAEQKFVSLWTMGLNQSTAGTWNANALCNLHLALGAICRPGAGPFSLTGQPNAMGGREMGYMGPGLPGQRLCGSAEDRAFTEAIWGLPADRLRDAPAAGAVEMFDEMAAGRIKACWIICTNPAVSMPARARTIAGLKAAELVIVQDAFLDTETNQFADILLPGALWAEADGVMVNSERNLTLGPAAVPPPGEAMADWRIIAAVATEMGFAGFTYAGAAEIFEELKRFANPRTGYDIRGASHARLEESPLQWPCGPADEARNPIRYIENGAPRFPTETGKARFFARPHLPAAELPDESYPFILNTGRVQHQWHTLTKTGKIPQLNRLNGGPFVEINPADAAALGLAPDDRVELRSRRGRAVLPARLSDRVQPGCVFAPFHWNDVFGESLAVNEITSAATDAISLQPEFKFCAVALSRVPAPASEPAAHEAGDEDPFLPEERLYMQGFLKGVELQPVGVPVLPECAPVAAERRPYLNGLLAGMFSRVAEAARPRVTILYASQTGNAESMARAAAKRFGVEALAMDEVTPDALQGTALFFASSFGDGDPPDNAAKFWRLLAAPQAPRLADLRFGVLAFGDSAYPQFCGFGARLEARLLALGAWPLLPRQDCEPDFEAEAQTWLGRAEAALGRCATEQPGDDPAGYSRARPYTARLIANTCLNRPGSEKETRHLVFDLGDSGLSYEPGDALGVWPENDPDEVERVARLTGLDISVLARQDIRRVTPALLEFCLARSRAIAGMQDRPERVLDRNLIDLLEEYPVVARPEEWLAVLKPLAPRLYSIASSLRAHPCEAHLTVNILRFAGQRFAGQRSGAGLCSGYLADRAETARIFIQPSGHFHLPADDRRPVVMIGPGTGIAPFRAFLQERQARQAPGRNWLVFGEQRAECDFYFRDELERMARAGLLHRLTTAFSRDQAQKIYVQDRLREEGAELWRWIAEGANVYVCGDAARMARDVDLALREILALHGGLSDAAAARYLEAMAAQKRYLRDVY